MDDPTAEEIAAMEAFLGREDRRKTAMEAQPYDGAAGKPTEWVPDPIIQRFRETRDDLLAQGWTLEQIVHQIDSYGTEDWVWHHRTPEGREIAPREHHRLIGILAHIRWVAGLEPTEGLRELAGEDATHGHSVREGSKKPRKDTLRILMEDAYKGLCADGSKPTWRDVLAALRTYDEPDELKSVIQEIDDDTEMVFWLDRRDNEKKTSFAAFRDRLTTIRNSHQ